MKYLKTYRKNKGLTQNELAKLLGVGQSTVAMWENGCSMPVSAMLPRLADALGCSIDALYGREPADELRKEEPA